MPWEILSQLVIPSIENPVVVSLGIGVVRSLAGWLENLAREWETEGFTRPSLSKLAETFFRTLPQTLGFASMGLPAETAFLSDLGLSLLKKFKK